MAKSTWAGLGTSRGVGLAAAAVGVGGAALAYYHWKRVDGRAKQDGRNMEEVDILGDVLEKSFPVAAAEFLGVDVDGGSWCPVRSSTMKCRLGEDRHIVITADPHVATYVFKPSGKPKNYRRRPGADAGLRELGMFHHGLIWNNDLEGWKCVRSCFQHALNDEALGAAASVAGRECKLLVETALSEQHALRSAGPTLNLLGLARQVTFRTTLEVFFGVTPADFSAAGLDEAGFITSIVDYFKAWEFFLMRGSFAAAQAAVHKASVETLLRNVRSLLAITDMQIGEESSSGKTSVDHKSIDPCAAPRRRNAAAASSSAPLSSVRQRGCHDPSAAEPKAAPGLLFIDRLRAACVRSFVTCGCGYAKVAEGGGRTMLEQSVLEMLLAGTDTSSVTAYYSLLAIAGESGLQNDVRAELETAEGQLLSSVIDETLRFKPVGPVVLREAIQEDTSFPGVVGGVKSGDAVLVHLQAMNRRTDLWGATAGAFDGRRFLKEALSADALKKKFMPFGDGPKGCIGMWLGRCEVRAILETIVASYRLEVVGVETLGSLETHWDIANQPDTPALIRVSHLDL